MKKLIFLVVVVSATAVLMAHPHFRKTITVELGSKVTLAYQTTPANESHAQKAAVGNFITPRRPTLQVASDLKAGSVNIPAGEYTIGAIKNGADDWTMALLPGQMSRGQSPDMSKVIKLESVFSKSQESSQHLVLDIVPGHGKFEGRPVLMLHFGSMSLEGALG